VRLRLLRTRAYCFHAREKKKKQKKQISLWNLGLFEKRKVQTFAHDDVIKYYCFVLGGHS
jgi:hypothetical protein